MAQDVIFHLQLLIALRAAVAIECCPFIDMHLPCVCVGDGRGTDR